MLLKNSKVQVIITKCVFIISVKSCLLFVFVIVLISERMQRPPKRNWWIPTHCPHRGLAAHAQEPPPHSPWCTTWGPGVNPSAFQLWQLLNTTAKATFRPFPRPPNGAPPPPPRLQPTLRPALHPNWVPETWPAWGPLLSWSLPKQRPFRLYRRDLNRDDNDSLKMSKPAEN